MTHTDRTMRHRDIMETLTDWIDFDFSVYEQAMYGKFQLDIGPTVTLCIPDYVREDYAHKPHLFKSKMEHDEYELSYRVHIGEKVRFDNLAPNPKCPIFDNLDHVHLTLGKLYTVEDCSMGPSFGKKTWLTIRNDKGDLVRHYRGRFTKMNVSAIPEPEDVDII